MFVLVYTCTKREREREGGKEGGRAEGTAGGGREFRFAVVKSFCTATETSAPNQESSGESRDPHSAIKA